MTAGAFVSRRWPIDSRVRRGATGAAGHGPSVCASGAGAGSEATEPRSRAPMGLGAPAPLPCESRPERSGGPALAGWRTEHVWDNGPTSGGVPNSPPQAAKPLRVRGRERRLRERRSGGPGSGAARSEARTRFPDRSGQRVPKAERSSTRPQGRDRRRRFPGKRSAQRACERRREGYPPAGTRPRSGLGRVARSRSDAPNLPLAWCTALTSHRCCSGPRRRTR